MRIPKIVAYLAHPVGPGSTLAELEARRENIANALAWMHYLVDVTPWAISVPWLPYVQVLDEGTYRERGIADDLAGLERCDVCVLTGGRISEGMAKERDAAILAGLPVINLISFGFRPPTRNDIGAMALIGLKVKQAKDARPRRVWLPRLSVDEIGELKGNRAVLRSHAVDFGVLDSVIAAAEVAP
jgi:hypothetical protein